MLKYRVLTGGLFLGLVAALYVWAPTWGLGMVILVLTTLAVLEIIPLVTKAGFPALKWTSLVVSLLWMLGVWGEFSIDNGSRELRWMMPAISAWVVFLGCLFRSDQSNSLEKLAGSFFAIAYVAGLMQFLLLILFLGGNGHGDGRSLLLYGILVVKSTDMGAYFIGSAFGRHKLIPEISPAKSWEGVVGGVAVAMAVSSLLLWLFGYSISGTAFTWRDGLILGAGLAVFGVLGDLVESMLKRSAQVKDSGGWLKGMGGMLDVLDSLIFALPLLYLYVAWGWSGV